MDRRRFLHMFLTAPALTPLLLAAEQATHHGGELFLISDKPEDYLPVLLAESAGFLPLAGKSFCFNSPHPQQQQLRQRLEKLGWAPAALPSRAHLRLSPPSPLSGRDGSGMSAPENSAAYGMPWDRARSHRHL